MSKRTQGSERMTLLGPRLLRDQVGPFLLGLGYGPARRGGARMKMGPGGPRATDPTQVGPTAQPPEVACLCDAEHVGAEGAEVCPDGTKAAGLAGHYQKSGRGDLEETVRDPGVANYLEGLARGGDDGSGETKHGARTGEPRSAGGGEETVAS